MGFPIHSGDSVRYCSLHQQIVAVLHVRYCSLSRFLPHRESRDKIHSMAAEKTPHWFYWANGFTGSPMFHPLTHITCIMATYTLTCLLTERSPKRSTQRGHLSNDIYPKVRAKDLWDKKGKDFRGSKIWWEELHWMALNIANVNCCFEKGRRSSNASPPIYLQAWASKPFLSTTYSVHMARKGWIRPGLF